MIVWGCGFEVDKTGDRLIVCLPPTKGVIEGCRNCITYEPLSVVKFHPIVKRGKALKKGFDIPLTNSPCSNYISKALFDNEQECIDYFNNLIDVQIRYFQDQINRFKKLKIKK